MINKLRSRKGYSFAELLIVIAIIAIIGAISIGGIFSQIKSIRQMKLDTTARTIYTAAQNRLTELYSSGDTARFSDVIKRNMIPGDWDDGTTNDSTWKNGKTLTIVRSDKNWTKAATGTDIFESDSNSNTELKRLILPENAVSEEIYNNNWVIEFNPENGYVYSVFYSEDDDHTPDKFYDEPDGSSISTADTDAIRQSKANRINNTDARVGYYFGNFSITEGTSTEDIKNYISWDSGSALSGANSEQLKLNFVTELPQKLINKKVNYYITITGKTSESSCSYELIGLMGGNTKRTKSLIIDRLVTEDTIGTENDLSFYTNFCSGKDPSAKQSSADKGQTISYVAGSRTGNFIPGEDLEISFKVTGTNESDNINSPMPDVKIVNSLFADGTDTSNKDATANISCGRHLQNLDATTSHIGEAIPNTKSGVKKLSFVSAVQTGKIDFTDEGKFSWKKIYGNRKFSPIESTDKGLNSYDGANYIINGIDIGSYPKSTDPVDAGLFGVFYGSELKNITLTGLKANGSNNRNAGGLASKLGSDSDAWEETVKSVTISNCKVYLNTFDYDGKDESYAFIKSENSSGGLVGVANVNTEIINSFASTVIRAGIEEVVATSTDGKGAGGLIGWTKQGFIINGSYADCYISGRRIGGLIGYTAGGDTAGSKIIGSYSAGFAILENETEMAAGFVGSGEAATTISHIIGSYTVFDTGSSYSVSAHQYSTVATSYPNFTNVYYCNNSKENKGGEAVASAKLKSAGADGVLYELNNALDNALNDLGVEAKSRFEFDTKAENSRPYNLKSGLALKVYEYPHIKSNSKITVHYGDWADKDFKSGALVYFENYSNGKWGFYGNSSDTLYKDTVVNENNNISVISDGYALVYDAAAYSDTAPLSITFNGNTYDRSALTKVTVEAGQLAFTTTDGWNDKTVLLLLPYAIANAGLKSDRSGDIDTGYLIDHFYKRISVVNGSTTDHYFFNPHFAKSVNKAENDSAAQLIPMADERIYIRSARQLYLLSKFYGAYNKTGDVEGRNFYQELDINYKNYNWATASPGYTSLTDIGNNRVQSSIADGSSEDESFRSGYNGRGHIITGFSIHSTGNSLYSGLFGLVKGGKLENIVIAADYSSADKFSITNIKAAQNNGEKAYLGMLAGYIDSASTVTNCAAASYSISGYAYGNSDVYVGGLIGYNEGTISKCSADVPLIEVFSNGTSDAYTGSFTAYNSRSGKIIDCYALAYIDAGTSNTSGEFKLGGFAGINNGKIEGSYCAAAYTSSNLSSGNISAFSQGITGTMERCMYLNGGNYYYVDSVRPYNYDTDSNLPAQSVTSAQLIGLIDDSDTTYTLENDLSTAFGNAEDSFYHACTNNDNSVKYPYPAVVTKNDGTRVHYGEWAYDSSFGSMGFIYWEQEEKGSNNGYHFYMIDDEGNEYSTLCESHDDGGVITAYGYGFYYKPENAADTGPSAEWDNVNLGNQPNFVNAKDATKDSSCVGAAKNAFEKQFGGSYKFELYRTTESGVKPETLNTSSKEADDGGMFLIGDSAYASCTLNKGTKEIQYIFTPFFGRSMVLVGVGEITNTDDAKAKLGHGTGYGADGKPSKENGFPFEIRSTSQLQNINWRSDKLNATTEVTSADIGSETNEYIEGFRLTIRGWKWREHHKARETFNHYTYLGWFAADDTQNKHNEPIRYDKNNYIHNYYWNQTHDTKNVAGKIFTPIGSLYDIKDKVNEIAINGWVFDVFSQPYTAYFNGYYDGRSYKIQNIIIDSSSQTVGLFGTTVCAKLQNIIMYADDDKMNKISTNANGTNWYSLGSLVGFAAQGEVINCASAGYVIENNRKYVGAGNANIGGLAGFCGTDIINCSSVNNIKIDCNYNKEQKNSLDSVNSICVGGMVGICPGIISGSYCGGKIESSASNTKIYIGGIVGGEWFKAQGLDKLTNFGSLEENTDVESHLTSHEKPQPKIYNSYSYMNLPVAGTNDIKVVRPIASTGDLGDYSSAKIQTILINNSYYYGAYANNASINPIYYSRQKKYDIQYLNSDGSTISNGNLLNVMALSYDNMKNGHLLGRLNAGGAGFANVTTTENGGARIDGKYSFPGSDAFLKGENYPFPAIVTQENPFYDADFPMSGEAKNVYVHYGAWPLSGGLFTDIKSAEIDLLTSDTGAQDINVKYYQDGNLVDMTAVPSVSTSSGNFDTVSCSFEQKTDVKEPGKRYYTLKVQGLSEGYETLTISYNSGGIEYTKELEISVTAEMSVEINARDPKNATLYGGESVEYVITAKNKNGDEIPTTLANWTVYQNNYSKDKVRCKLSENKDSTGKMLSLLTVTGLNDGEAQVNVSSKDIYPRWDSLETTKPVNARHKMLELEVISREGAAQSVSVMLYADDERLDAGGNHNVNVSYAKAVNDNSTAKDNLDYWTSMVKNDASINRGRSFAGWVLDNGELLTSDAMLKSSVRASAAWKCAEITFYDKIGANGSYAKAGTLCYLDGAFYTNNTLTVPAVNAPSHKDPAGIDTFSGYWTEPDGGEPITDSEGHFTTDSGDTVPAKVYARYDVPADEVFALMSAVSMARAEAVAMATNDIIDTADADSLAAAENAEDSTIDTDPNSADSSLSNAENGEGIGPAGPGGSTESEARVIYHDNVGTSGPSVQSFNGADSNAADTMNESIDNANNDIMSENIDEAIEVMSDEGSTSVRSIIDPEVITDEDITYGTEND